MERNMIRMSKEDVAFVYNDELSRMVGFDQQNPHHCYNLWEHTVHTMMNVEGSSLKLAALYHDIGKPIVAALDERTGWLAFKNHAKESAKIAEIQLQDRADRDLILWLILHHDDFIPFKDKIEKWQHDHTFIRTISVETIAERLLENYFTWDGYAPDQVKYICRMLITGKNPTMKIKSEIPKPSKLVPNHFIPTLEDYHMLLSLCKADANAQAEIVYDANGKQLDSRLNKIERLCKIESLLGEAYTRFYFVLGQGLNEWS